MKVLDSNIKIKSKNVIYNNSNVENILNELNQKLKDGDVYSTDEVRIGTWIDGKPIYRKVFIITNRAFNKGTTTIAHNIANFKMCINARGFSELGIIMPYFNLSSDNNSIATFTSISNVDTTSFKIRIANDNWGAANNWYIVLEYTKTTD